MVRSRKSSKCFAIIAYMPRSPRKFHVVPSKSGWKLFSELVNVKITTNVPQRTIFDVSFPFHERKAANNSETVHFREHYQPPAAAILFSFALITHDPPTSAKSSIYSGYSAPGSRIAGMEIQVFRNENGSQTNAYSHYSN